MKMKMIGYGKRIFVIFIIIITYNTFFAYKKGYLKLKSNKLELLCINNKSLKKCFEGICIDIKNGKYSIEDMRGCIEICKQGAHDHYLQAKQISKKTLSLLNRYKIKHIKKETHRLEKKAIKLLATGALIYNHV